MDVSVIEAFLFSMQNNKMTYGLNIVLQHLQKEMKERLNICICTLAKRKEAKIECVLGHLQKETKERLNMYSHFCKRNPDTRCLGCQKKKKKTTRILCWKAVRFSIQRICVQTKYIEIYIFTTSFFFQSFHVSSFHLPKLYTFVLLIHLEKAWGPTISSNLKALHCSHNPFLDSLPHHA